MYGHGKCKNTFLQNWSQFKVQNEYLFVCFGGFLSYLRIYHSYEDFTITRERLQILTYARHSWPLSSEGSLACHTYCDTGHPFIMVTPDTCLVFGSGVVTAWFYNLGVLHLGFEHPTFLMREEWLRNLRKVGKILCSTLTFWSNAWCLKSDQQYFKRNM